MSSGDDERSGLRASRSTSEQSRRIFPARLHHETPSWVPDGTLFHVRLRIDAQQCSLVAPELASKLLSSVRRNHERGDWWCELFLLMPDHVHAILGFPADSGMSEVIRNWKRGTTRIQRVQWQDGYFDHRLRNNDEAQLKWHYIRRNPVVKNLCAKKDDWRWWWSAVVPNPLLP